MKRFQFSRYEIRSSKISQPVKICFLTDWHASIKSYTPSYVMKLLECEAPDLVLIGGDIVSCSMPESLRIADSFFRKAAGVWPIYYARGNHESKLAHRDVSRRKYTEYERRITSYGVRLLHNRHISYIMTNQTIDMYGFTLPVRYYRRPFPPRLDEGTIKKVLGDPDEKTFSILLAHTPLYGDRYFEWGADLTLCGHYHGGVLKLDSHHGVMSPQMIPFPGYCCGDFYRGKQTLITGTGLGDHSLPLRFNNPRELVTITLSPEI